MMSNSLPACFFLDFGFTLLQAVRIDSIFLVFDIHWVCPGLGMWVFAQEPPNSAESLILYFPVKVQFCALSCLFPAFQRTAWIRCALAMACAFKGSVTAPRDGEASTVRHRFPCARNSAQAMGLSSWRRGSAAVNRSGQVQTVLQVCWRFYFFKEPVLSVGVLEESSYHYCAGMNLTNEIGMNQGCCDMALNGIVSNRLAVDKDRKAFPL